MGLINSLESNQIFSIQLRNVRNSQNTIISHKFFSYALERV